MKKLIISLLFFCVLASSSFGQTIATATKPYADIVSGDVLTTTYLLGTFNTLYAWTGITAGVVNANVASVTATMASLTTHIATTTAHGATSAVVGISDSQTLTNKTMGSGCSWGGTAVPVANGGTGSTSAANARTALGLGNVSTLNIGTTAETAAAGDDSRFTNSRQCNNLFDSAATARTNLGVAYGTTAGTVCQGNDSRLSDSRQCNNTFADAATSRTNLGLGTAATHAHGDYQAAGSYAPAGGSVSTDFSVKDLIIGGSSYHIVYSGGAMKITLSDGSTLAGQYYASDFRGGSLSGSGNRAVYSDSTGVLTNSSSDQRLKKNVATLTNALDKVLSLRGVSYNWNTDVPEASRLGTQNEIGLIAQEVEPVVPEVVGTNGNGMKSVDYPKLTALLIEAVKDQQVQINDLKTRVQQLETK